MRYYLAVATREALHRIVDELPEDELEAAARSLAEKIGDPFLRAWLTAPEDDEVDTEEERALLERRWQSYKAGSFVEHEEVLRRLGLAADSLGD